MHIKGPQPPRSCLARSQINPHDVEGAKKQGWNQHRILVVAENDDRLNWLEKESVRQLGEKLYGRR